MATNNAINQIGVLPSFGVYSNTAQTSATGDGTSVTIRYDVAEYDKTSSFNTGSHAFVAPLTGIYSFVGSMNITGIVSANTNAYIYFVTTGTTYYPYQINPYATAATSPDLAINFSIIVPLTAGDSAYVKLRVDLNATKNITINSGSSYTRLSGYMIAGI